MQRPQPGDARRTAAHRRREVLRYKPFKVDVAIVRGTYADARGNVSPEEEAIDMDVHSIALAAHNSGGLVLAQVRQVVGRGQHAPPTRSDPGHHGRRRGDAPSSSSSTGSGMTRRSAAPVGPTSERARRPFPSSSNGESWHGARRWNCEPGRVAELRLRDARRHLRCHRRDRAWADSCG